MKSFNKKLFLSLIAFALALASLTGNSAFADGDDEQKELMEAATSISISPVNKILQLEADKTYEDSFEVANNGSSTMRFEVYASPYSYTYSEADQAYRLGFNNENNYTQISRWITFKDKAGNWVEKATFEVPSKETFEVHYKISTPSSIPAGGQYAVLFAHTLSDKTTSGGIKAEASPGLVVYGRAVGETILSSEVSDMEIHQTLEVGTEKKNIINGKAKVKNTGNVDFMASGRLKVTGIFGNVYYETPSTSTSSRVSIIPETELEVTDSWQDTPYFGLFNVEWTVTAASGNQTITMQVLILPLPIIVLIILLLTIITIWIIVIVRKRRERRARFSF